MNIQKNKTKWHKWAFITSLIVAFPLIYVALFAWGGNINLSTSQDIDFQTKLNEKTLLGTTPVKVSEIHSGDWTSVCPVAAYDRASRVAAAGLQLSANQIDIFNTNDEVASDGIWGLVFLYPPNRAEYIRITNYFYASKVGCVERDFASFQIIKAQPKDRLQLLSTQ